MAKRTLLGALIGSTARRGTSLSEALGIQKPTVSRVSGGAASFGGGRSGVGSGIQERAASRLEAITRPAELRQRTDDLAKEDRSLGVERAGLNSDKHAIDVLDAKIRKAEKNPYMTTFTNRLKSERGVLAENYNDRQANFNERIGERNADARGLSEQFMVKKVADLREQNVEVTIVDERGRAVTTGTQRTVPSGFIEQPAVVSIVRDKGGVAELVAGGGGFVTPSRPVVEKVSKAPKDIQGIFLETVKGISEFGKESPKFIDEALLGETIEDVPLFTKKRIKKIKKAAGEGFGLLATLTTLKPGVTTLPILIGKTTLKFAEVGAMAAGLGFVKIGEPVIGALPDTGVKFTDPFGVERQLTKGGLYRALDISGQIGFYDAALTLPKALGATKALATGKKIPKGIRLDEPFKNIKIKDIGQIGGIGAGKKKVLKLPDIPTIKRGDIPGTFTVPRSSIDDLTEAIKRGNIADLSAFAKRESGIVKERLPKFAEEFVGGLKSGRVPKITEKFAKKERGRFTTLGLPEQKIAFGRLAKKGKVPAFDARSLKIIDMPKKIDLSGVVALVKTKPIKPKFTFKRTPLDFGYLKKLDTVADLGPKSQVSFKKFVSEITEGLKPYKKVEKDIGFFPSSKISAAEATERGSILKEIRAAEARIAVTTRVPKTIKAKPLPSLSLTVPGSYAALAFGLSRIAKTPTQRMVDIPKTDTVFGEYAKMPSIFKKADFTPIEKAMRQQIRVETKGKRRFSDYLGIDLTPATASAMGLTSKVSEKERKKELDKYFGSQQLGISTKIIYDTGIKTQIKTGRKSRLEISTKITPIDITMQSTKLKLDVIPIIRIKTPTRIVQKIKQDYDFHLPQIDIPKKPDPYIRKIPVLFPKISMLKNVPKLKTLKYMGYRLEVRRKGKWTPAFAGVFTEKSAKGLAQQLVGGTPLASFRITKAFGIPKMVSGLPTFKPEQFRKPIKGGISIPSSIWIEKTKFRIDQPGELKGITYKGLEALAMFPAKRKKKKGKKRKKKRR